MENQYQTIIPSKLNYIPLTFHKINNTKFTLIIGFDDFIYDNIMDYV